MDELATNSLPRRVRRERRTVAIMIGMYCRAHHATNGGTLCGDCRALHDDAMHRIEKCPYCPDKPSCTSCPIHCYKPDRREQVKDVMRYAGPRMLRRHPWLAIMHILDGRRKVESLGRREGGQENGRAGDGR